MTRNTYYPKFYVRGKPAHVGRCFEGYDATTAAAFLAETVTKMPCAEGQADSGEPEIVDLFDLKPEYNVQTAPDVYVAFVVKSTGSPELMQEKMKKAAEHSLRLTADFINERYKGYCGLCKMDYHPIGFNVEAITLAELYEKAGRKQPAGNREPNSLKEIGELLDAAGLMTPTMVIYFGSSPEVKG